MKEPKFLTLLKTFSNDEWKEFEKFLRSPYHNNERNFIPLYNYIKGNIADTATEVFTDKNIYKNLYPGKNFDGKKSSLTIRVLCSQFVKLTEEFIEFEYFKKKEIFRQMALLDEFKNRRLNYYFENKYKIFSKHTSNELDDPFYLQRILLIESVNKSYYYSKENNKDDVISFRKSGETIIKSLIYNLIINLVGYMDDNLTSYTKDYSENEFIKFVSAKLNIEELIEHIGTEDSDIKEKLLTIYYVFKLDTDRTSYEIYHKFKELFLKISDKLTYGSIKGFITNLMNFCIYEELNKRDYFMNEYVQWNTMLVEKSLQFKQFDVFNIRQYRNLIRDFAINNKFKEIEEYNNKYIKYYEKEIQENCLIYADALTSFYKKDYVSAIKYINNCTFNIQVLVRDMKYYKFLSCLALGYYEQALNEIDNLKHYLKKSTSIPDIFIKTDNMVLKYAVLFVKYKADNNKEKFERLINDLEMLNTRNIHLQWLLQNK